MRAFFSIAALLIVVAIVAVMARQQLASVKVPELAASSPNQPAGGAPTRQNVQQQLDQLKKELDTAAQQSARQLEAE